LQKALEEVVKVIELRAGIEYVNEQTALLEVGEQRAGSGFGFDGVLVAAADGRAE